jgi:hypothetical protein
MNFTLFYFVVLKILEMNHGELEGAIKTTENRLCVRKDDILRH